MIYTLGLGSGDEVSGAVEATYDGFPGTLFLSALPLGGSAVQVINNAGIGNGASNLGPFVFVGYTNPTLVIASSISDGTPPQVGEVDQTRQFSQEAGGISLATDYERSYTPKENESMRFLNPNGEFRQYATINVRIPYARTLRAASVAAIRLVPSLVHES